MKKAKCKPLFSITAAVLAAGMVLTGCGGSSSGSSASSSADTQAEEQSSADSASSDADSVVIYCNSDDEALEVIKKTLDANGFEGKYTISTFGTSDGE